MLAIAVTIIAFVLTLIAGLASAPVLIAVAIGITFAVAQRHASPRPQRVDGAGAPPIAGRLKLWGGEIASAWSVFLFAMPLERWLMPRAVAPALNGSVPVLLIHGYVNNAAALWRLWKALVGKGFGVYTINLEPVYAGIDDYAAPIAARIAAIRAATGATGVVLVGHSMGGLAARAYLRACAQQQAPSGVAKVITLGSPHHGTALACFEVSTNGKQMRRDSTWLTQLAEQERNAWPCPLVSVYSFDDNVVAPQLSAHLDGARNIAIDGVGHISLPLSRRVIEIVLAEVVDAQ
jgi:triacylglycerol esterase/lipase EstA (alpha/beta hydrolase family)